MTSGGKADLELVVWLCRKFFSRPNGSKPAPAPAPLQQQTKLSFATKPSTEKKAAAGSDGEEAESPVRKANGSGAEENASPGRGGGESGGLRISLFLRRERE